MDPNRIRRIPTFPDEALSEYDRLCSFIDGFPWYRDRQVFEIINNHVPATCKMGLDIGCGTGIVLRYVASKRSDVQWIGIDRAPEMVASANLKCAALENVSILNVDWMQFAQDSKEHLFDFILLKNVLHLIFDVNAHLSALRSMLNITGRVVIVETVLPNSESGQFIAGLARSLGMLQIKKHIFTSQKLVKLLKYSGFEVERVQYHEQFIDIRRWIAAKSRSNETERNTLSYVESEMRSDDLRRSMKYSAPTSDSDGKMLRRQVIIQCVSRANKPS